MSYEFLTLERRGRVRIATLDAPPINLITLPLYAELIRLSEDIEQDDETSVFVLRSANPDFFIAHFDVEAILRFPTDTEPARDEAPNPFQLIGHRFRTMPKVTIAQIEGRIGGGGSELAMGFDLRYGVRGRTKINQMEVPIGILPGGGGTQLLPRLIGRGRALEVIMSGEDLDAETAERWGYLDRVLEPAEIGPFVDRIAERIASFPAHAIEAAKRAVNAAHLPLEAGFVEESYQFQRTLRDPSAAAKMRRFLDLGGQTPDGERRVGELNGLVSG